MPRALSRTPITNLHDLSELEIDFSVPDRYFPSLRPGLKIAVHVSAFPDKVFNATLSAIDARVDPTTRNAMIRAEIKGTRNIPAPGASVRVQVPAGPAGKAVAIPVSTLRKDPSGDHVFVIQPDKNGKQRAHVRQVRSGEALGDTVLIEDGLDASR